MSNIAVQRRRGTTVLHSTFTGLQGETTVDLDKKTVVVHDGTTLGGFPLARESVVTAHIANTFNPHATTKAQVGLGNADDTSDADKPLSVLARTTILSPLTAHVADISNPHLVTKTQIGLSAVDNTSDANKPLSTLDRTTILSPLTAHTADINNPHLVTKTQVGLSAVDNTSDINKPVSTVVATTILTPLTAHTADLNNPHQVTKTQVGLSAVDNTADVDKPISTATQAALDLKANILSPALSGTPHAPTATPGTNSNQIATTEFVAVAVLSATGGSFANPLTAIGDIIVGGSSGVPQRFGIGSEGNVLTVSGGTLVYASPAAGSNGTYTTTLTGSQNNFNYNGASVLYVNNAATLTITGLLSAVDGTRLDIISIGSASVELKNQDGSSIPQNRIKNQATGKITLAAGVGSATLIYDGSTGRWRTVAHEQGTAITVPYLSGNFTGSGTLIWTVELADQAVFEYYLKGRVITVWITIDVSSVSGSGSDLRVTIPDGYIAAKTFNSAILGSDNATQIAGFWYVQNGATFIALERNLSGSTWTTSTDATSIKVVATFEVQ